MREVGWLAALGLLGCVGLGAIGLVDYDEAAYAEVARVMWASGDWLVPRLCGELFFEKPPLLYWLQALGFALFGVGETGARIGTALAAAAAPLVLYGFARRPLGARAALFGALALGTSLEFAALARIAFTDMLLLLWFSVCLGALDRAFRDPQRGTGWFALACVASALAVLTKGAIGVLLPGAVALLELVLRGRLRAALRPGWIALALLIVPGLGFSWYLLLGLTRPGGFEFMRELFLEHHLGRFSQPMQGHSGSPLYYLPVLVVGMLPWSPFLPLALARARLRGRDERAAFLRMFASFSALVTVFFSIAATKLPNYLAPALPGFALLVGALLADEQRARTRADAISLGFAVGALCLLALAFALLPFAPALFADLLAENAAKVPGLAEPFRVGATPLLASLALLAAGALALLGHRARSGARVVASLAVGSALFHSIVFWTVLPRFDERFGAPLRRLAVRAAELVPEPEPIVLLGLRYRPSVCFYADRETEYVRASGGEGASQRLLGAPAPRIGITTDPLLDRFPASGRLEILARDSGHVLFRAPAAPSAH